MRPFSIFSIISILLIEVMTGCERQSIIRIDDDNSPVIIAHRGYWNREGGKQNDLESYKAAIEAGFVGAETDVRQTKDGVLVLAHDDIYEQKIISQSNYIELRGITTLEELLNLVKTAPKFKLIIEIKNADCTEVIKLIDLVGISCSQLVFFSFSQVYCKQLIGMKKGLDVAYLNGDMSPKELSKSGYNGMAYNYSRYLNEPNIVERAKDFGLDIYAWTVNSTEIMDQLVDLGCKYIITDQPNIMQMHLMQ